MADTVKLGLFRRVEWKLLLRMYLLSDFLPCCLTDSYPLSISRNNQRLCSLPSMKLELLLPCLFLPLSVIDICLKPVHYGGVNYLIFWKIVSYSRIIMLMVFLVLLAQLAYSSLNILLQNPCTFNEYIH